MTTGEFKRFQRFLNYDGRIADNHGWLILYFPEAEHDWQRFVKITAYRQDVRKIIVGEYIYGHHYKQIRKIHLWIRFYNSGVVYF